MPTFMTFLLRLFLMAAGLVVAISMGLAALLMVGFWGVRAVWARLTGNPAVPFVVRIDPRGGFGRMYRRPEQHEESRTPRADSIRPGRKIPDVTDVEPKSPSP